MPRNNDTDEEELLIYLDFKQFLPFEELIDPDTQIKIIGLETENPICQINGRFYQGDYEFATGTKLFFTEFQDPPQTKNDWESDPNSKIVPFEYIAKTNKVLKMNRVFITSKEDLERVNPELDNENTSKYEITTTYAEVLSRFLPPAMEPPRMISETENGLELMKKTLQEIDDRTDDEESIEEVIESRNVNEMNDK